MVINGNKKHQKPQKTPKHQMVIMVQKTSKKQQIKYECNLCDFNTLRKNNYEQHLLTPKHKMVQNGHENQQKTAQYFMKQYYKVFRHFFCKYIILTI